MEKHYTSEKNVLMLIALMKAHGVKRVVASPGTTNISFVASLQHDPYFEIFSSVDERSAAYLACGLAAETQEPVALSCTGATASRNYVSGLTEAYYRNLPILAITSTQHTGRIGQMIPQVIDRSNPMNDIAVYATDIPTIGSREDEWASNVKINTALLALRRYGGGPVHINLVTTYSNDFSVETLPDIRVIRRVEEQDPLPSLENYQRIGIFVGAHLVWTPALTEAVDHFCEAYNAIVLCDNSSNYCGKYGVYPNLVTNQGDSAGLWSVDLLIHMGNISGAYISIGPKEVWRVHPDGEVRDLFHTLSYTFAMEEVSFFRKYNALTPRRVSETTYYQEWHHAYQSMRAKIPELPFSNIWMAQQTFSRIPENSILHLGILNTLRSWNFFASFANVRRYVNTGGFGIDGILSSAVGSSLADPQKLCFVVLGDLAFFYDINVLGNRHVGANLRILLINNGVGAEFKNYNHRAAQFGDDANAFVAAAGHYGQKSPLLIKNYAENLGFEYLSARTKEEYLTNLDRFLNPTITQGPMLFEVFTDSEEESRALELMNTLNPHKATSGEQAKAIARKILGNTGTKIMKKALGKSEG